MATNRWRGGGSQRKADPARMMLQGTGGACNSAMGALWFSVTGYQLKSSSVDSTILLVAAYQVVVGRH